VDCLGALEQSFFSQNNARGWDAAVHRAHHDALLLIEKTDALSARILVDHVHHSALANASVRAHRLTGVARDTILGYHQGHFDISFATDIATNALQPNPVTSPVDPD
jgi:hypothetical protein